MKTTESSPLCDLTFAQLRRANVARLPQFKNRLGGPAHSEPDGSDWSLGEWCNAVLGELGEAANLIKKVQRGDIILDEARGALAREYADVVTYMDLLAFRTGVDLGAVVMEKWNEVSERVDVPLRLDAESSVSCMIGGCISSADPDHEVTLRVAGEARVLNLCEAHIRQAVDEMAARGAKAELEFDDEEEL